jgi:hypothetical protein
MPDELTVIDPLGKTIYLLPEFCAENEPQEIYDDVTIIIRKPAMLIETNENDETRFYYFRSVGWNKTLFIITHWKNNRWEAYKCIKNPSGEILSIILKKGKQIF